MHLKQAFVKTCKNFPKQKLPKLISKIKNPLNFIRNK